jgi:tetratricopeptide (TPR) repeat protein
MGKTTLAIAVCQALRGEFEDGVLWANIASTDPAAILEDWAQVFGYDFSRLPDVESRAAALRGVLAEKRLLMVLDDVASLARIRPLLPHNRSVKVLITTRDGELAHRISDQVQELGQLSSGQAGQLLSQLIGSERTAEEAAAAQAICDLLQNLPLAVEIVGQRLRLFRSMTLAEMAARLRNERQRLAELELSDQAVRASFAISYRALDSYEKRGFALMGVFNGRSFPREAFAAIAELDYFTAGDRLFALEGASLVQIGEDSRFQQHPLLADFAREKLEEDGERERGYGRYAHHYLRFVQEHQKDYDTLRPEWDNMMAAIRAAYDYQFWPLIINLANALRDAWFARGRYNEAQQGYRWAVEAARSLQDENILANCLLNWGKVCTEQGDYETAAKHLTESLALARRLENKAATAAALDALAHVLLEQTQYDMAIQLLTESRQLWTELGDEKGIATSLYWEGRVLSRTYAHEAVRTICQHALTIQNNIGDQIGALQTLRLLARVAIFEDQYDLAQSYCEQSLTLCDIIQEVSERANTLYTLSVVHTRKNELEKARKVLEEGQLLFRRMGNQKMYGLTLHALSGVEERQGNLEAALQVNFQGSQIFRDLGDQHNLVFLLLHRAKLQVRTDQLLNAHQLCQEALQFVQTNNHPEKVNIELLNSQIEQKLADFSRG